MADKIVMVDTSILIDYYRKTNKENSYWIGLVREGYKFAISSVTKYEIYTGATQSQLSFWDNVLQSVDILALDETAVDISVEINAVLKRKRKQIDIADLFIAATAVANNLPLATINRKHFERIDRLNLIGAE